MVEIGITAARQRKVSNASRRCSLRAVRRTHRGGLRATLTLRALTFWAAGRLSGLDGVPRQSSSPLSRSRSGQAVGRPVCVATAGRSRGKPRPPAVGKWDLDVAERDTEFIGLKRGDKLSAAFSGPALSGQGFPQPTLHHVFSEANREDCKPYQHV